jgi:hypothetical protein
MGSNPIHLEALGLLHHTVSSSDSRQVCVPLEALLGKVVHCIAVKKLNLLLGRTGVSEDGTVGPCFESGSLCAWCSGSGREQRTSGM